MYADDVEGRTSKSTAEEPSSASGASAHKTEPSAALRTENGTDFSASKTPPAPEGGWASRAWHKLRDLTGL